jgi:hypothetical protein
MKDFVYAPTFFGEKTIISGSGVPFWATMLVLSSTDKQHVNVFNHA